MNASIENIKDLRASIFFLEYLLILYQAKTPFKEVKEVK